MDGVDPESSSAEQRALRDSFQKERQTAPRIRYIITSILAFHQFPTNLAQHEISPSGLGSAQRRGSERQQRATLHDKASQTAKALLQ